MDSLDDLEKYKTDKQIEYFKYIGTAQIATVGFLVSQKQELGLDQLPNGILWASIAILVFTLLASLLGYIFLINSLFVEEKYQAVLIKNCRFVSGIVFVVTIFAILLRAVNL